MNNIDPEGQFITAAVIGVTIGGTVVLAVQGYFQFQIAKAVQRQWKAWELHDALTGCESENPETERLRREFLKEAGKIVPIIGEIVVGVVYP